MSSIRVSSHPEEKLSTVVLSGLGKGIWWRSTRPTRKDMESE